MTKRKSNYLRKEAGFRFPHSGKQTALKLSTRHLSSLYKNKNKNDPISKQLLSSSQTIGRGIKDFSQESRYRVFPWLIHRYPDRVVVLASNQCFAYCRFCFRRDFLTEKPFKLRGGEVKALLEYLKAHPEVKEVITSGGDPLTLSDSILKKLIEELGKIEHLILLRLATRALSFCPERFSSQLIKILKHSPKPIWVLSHFNHFQELSSKSKQAIELLRKAGIPILNQTVLLKGVNNSAEILSQLFSQLAGLGIKPYYLFQCDPVPGAVDFTTPLEESFQIMEELSQLSGITLPKFALELPGYGKLSFFAGWRIQPEKPGYRFISPSGETYFYPRG